LNAIREVSVYLLVNSLSVNTLHKRFTIFMKTLIINLFFIIITTISFAQRKQTRSFNFQNNEIEYTRVDYSKYGVVQFFITMYEDQPEIKLIEQKSIGCLRHKGHIYHSLYFFVKIPKTIKVPKQKSELFSQFIKHLKQKEEMEKFNLYLNFDINYSIPYQLAEKDNKLISVERVTTNITPKKVCKTLTIR